MIKQAAKTAVVVAASAIAVPYAIAILFNMIHGWPQRKDKYGRALHPKRVYALNYVVLQEMTKIRYLGLMLRWKYFYMTSSADRVVKDLPYGSHDNTLDLYLPHDDDGHILAGNKPVILFVYGGSWGSGDKSMYGLLCCQLADRLKAIVCCPNYSNYPKGYVDDMVQDVVDCMTWVQQNGERFCGDKKRLILIGHSAGGHLCVLSVLELTLKRLLYHPESVLYPFSGSASLSVSRQSSIFSESIRFEDKHFNGSNASSIDNNGEGSFYVVDEKDNEKSFIVLESEKESSADEGTEKGSLDVLQDDNQEESVAVSEGAVMGDQKKEVKFEVEEMSGAAEVEEEGEEDVLRVEVTETCEESGSPEIAADPQLTQAQQEAQDILSSIKLVIGLAGVYQIADHYEHEASRGIETISTMAKAMYGSEHFDRLSPTHIVSQLPEKIRLPPILLIHGDVDKTVPLSSSVKLGQALYDKSCYDISVSVLPGCGHTDICLDLMDPSRKWYSAVMGEIMKGVHKCL